MVDVSLILPCYNAEDYIDKCLKIILSDKLKSIEIIAINDGSKDNTIQILNSYKKKYKQLKIIDQENTGQAIARNRALDKAKGKYVMFVDVDDFLEKNAIYKMFTVAEKNNSDYVYCDYYKHYEHEDIVVSNYFSEDPKKNAILANYAPWGKLIRMDLIKETKFKFLEGKIFEDIAVMPITAAKSKNPYHIKEPLYYYNLANLNSTIRTPKYKKKYGDIFEVSDYIYTQYSNDNKLSKYNDEFEYIFLNGILRCNILLFAKYKEGLINISKLRKNVLQKFPKIQNNKYAKNEPARSRLITQLILHIPPKLLYIIKKIVN